MKNQIYKLSVMLTAIVLVFTFNGCHKDEVSSSPETAKSIFDLKVSPSFDWKTTQDLELKVTGLRLPVTIKNTIYVRSQDGRITYYNDLLEMHKDYTINLSIPAYVNQLVISYGTISKTVDITGKTLNFNYSSQR
jgi:hypothetical protein